ncbi:MAG: hypothetical protein QXL00_07470, partial [Conexivisphaerales archaeon]
RLRLKEGAAGHRAGHKPEENAVANSEGSYARKREVFNRLGREGWKRAKEYGWWRYSSLYQEGDSVSSRRFQKAELSLKVLLYSRFQSM